MNANKDDRQREYFQTFRSETKTLAICAPGITPNNRYATFINSRVRITKQDRRLPLLFFVAFEPDGGSPDDAHMASSVESKITVRELVLLNRSYIAIVNRLGTTELGGALDFSSQRGSLGIAIPITNDCDAVDIAIHLGAALGGQKSPSPGDCFGGRWICGYSITCNDRLSSEEWHNAVNRSNMQVDTYCNATETNGTPILGSSTFIPGQDGRGEDTEGTGGRNIPNTQTSIGTGTMG